MANLSKLEEIKDLREVWPHEALDFTPWLSREDIDATAGIPLTRCELPKKKASQIIIERSA